MKKSLTKSFRSKSRVLPSSPNTRRAPSSVGIATAPRSAYVLRDEVRWAWQHSIAATPLLRYSITFRTRVTA